MVNSLYYPHVTGGAERSVQLLAEGLKKTGLEPVVVSTADRDKIDFVNGIKVYYLKINNLYWMRTAKQQPAYKKPLWHLIDSYNPFVVSKLTHIINSEKPDVLHTNNLAGFSVAVWKTARDSNVPIVHTIRDHYLLCPNSTMYRNDKNCSKQCLCCRMLSSPRKRYSSHVDAVVGVSRFILEKHRKHNYFPDAKIATHIYNPSDTADTHGSEINNNNVVTFGIIGLLAPIKGTEYLIRRFASMKNNPAKLKIFGRGITEAYENMLIERYKSDNIEFMGFKKPEEIYREIDVAIIPSLCDDAFPRIMIEAYSHGLPVIATSMGGASEMIDNGKTGCVFDPSLDGDLESKIDKFISDPGLARALSPACREKAEIFHIDKVVARYTDIYSQVIR